MLYKRMTFFKKKQKLKQRLGKLQTAIVDIFIYQLVKLKYKKNSSVFYNLLLNLIITIKIELVGPFYFQKLKKTFFLTVNLGHMKEYHFSF